MRKVSMEMKNAFTLAEAIAVLVLMGVVFAITVPSAISNAAVKSRQLKLKRAMSIYQQAVENMIVENDIPRTKTAFEQFANDDDCLEIRKYFRNVSTIDDNGCKFLSVNEIYWDFTNGATKPIVAFNKDYFNKDTAESDANTAFIMSTKFSNDGGIRVNDLGYEKENNDNDAYMNIAKMDCFINNRSCRRSDFKENEDKEG